MQGLRAFLPLAEFIKHPDSAKGESHEAYVSGCEVMNLGVSIPALHF